MSTPTPTTPSLGFSEAEAQLRALITRHAKDAFSASPGSSEVVFCVDLEDAGTGMSAATLLTALRRPSDAKILPSWQGEVQVEVALTTGTSTRCSCRTHAVTFGGLRYLAVSSRLSTLPPSSSKSTPTSEVLGVATGAPPFRNGLLLIAGRTGSGKTQLVAELILTLLQQSPPSASEKTFLTAEDPFELLAKCESLHPDWVRNTVAGTQIGTIGEPKGNLLACIPRDLTQDGDLHQVLLDALRQTPYLVFVGELREDDDWRQVMRFAMTGHRVIATTHASSVHECLLRLFKATEARTAAERAIALQSVHGVVHNQIFESHDPPTMKLQKYYVPSCWWATPLARKQLAGDRLCGLVAAHDPSSRVGYTLGKSFFVLNNPERRKNRDLVRGVVQHDLLGV